MEPLEQAKREDCMKPLNNRSTQISVDVLEHVLESELRGRDARDKSSIIAGLWARIKASGHTLPILGDQPYINTIPLHDQPKYPGDLELERKIRSYVRWNAMAMVVKANRLNEGIGGHISTYASCATLYEVGFNHFFRGGQGKSSTDYIYFQGHASPGIYARAYLEGRISEEQLHGFRQELSAKGGLPSYPHPYLMPEFWQFPTVSMGLGPLLSIYQARYSRYLEARKLVPKPQGRVWCFVGDGEMDEPESAAALTLAAREGLDNLCWVVNCNLQSLDGPVRGNGKIILELEALFSGAGWNVIKVIWGRDWDPLLDADKSGLLRKRMKEAVDGDYQKYSVSPGSFIRRHFFGKYPETLELVSHLRDEQLQKLIRGGHDPQKVYAAYRAAADHKGRPTVILAKTIKGYGLGEAGEGRNITHQQKKLNEKELREFKKRFRIPLSDIKVVGAPFYKPRASSREMKYLKERRKKLGGPVPKRRILSKSLAVPDLESFGEFFEGSGGRPVSSTMALVRMLGHMLKNPELGQRIVPIIPDEARTFGLDALFRKIGIYSSRGQLYEPVDKGSFLHYRETKDGQILQEGITEAGAMASFIAAGTSHVNHGQPTIPFFIYYSMFGFQRIGDLIWLAGDIKARGFLLGATAGRTTLAGEGLQHQDGHSQILASAVPSLMTYDPAFAFEIAVIVQSGLERMYKNKEEIFYYITLYNESYPMPKISMAETNREGILKGIYKYKKGPGLKGPKVHLMGSGAILLEAQRAQKILAQKYKVSADLWSVTSYKLLRNNALEADRWNRLHPGKKPRVPYIVDLLKGEFGPFIAATDYMKLVPDQIAPWIPGGLTSLGTDGFGRSDNRRRLRRFFEVDAECIVIAALNQLYASGQIRKKMLIKAIEDLEVNPEKAHPALVS